jgi:hypothetical protein
VTHESTRVQHCTLTASFDLFKRFDCLVGHFGSGAPSFVVVAVAVVGVAVAGAKHHAAVVAAAAAVQVLVTILGDGVVPRLCEEEGVHWKDEDESLADRGHLQNGD